MHPWQQVVVAVDQGGGKRGKGGQVDLADASDNPEWVTVSSGIFGGTSFVPLDANFRLVVDHGLVVTAP